MKKTIIFPMLALIMSLMFTGCLVKTSSEKQKINENQNQNNQASEQTNQTETAQTQNTNNDNPGGIEKITGGIAQLLGLNKSMKCTWDKLQEKDSIKGEVYLSGDKYYQEVTFPDNGKFFALIDGEYFYTWNTRVPGGTKAKLDKNNPGDVNKTVTDATENNEFTCVPWVVDESKLTAPSDIAFTDNTEEMKELQDDLDAMKKNPCQTCDNIALPELKTKCRQELKCAE
jgi:hypothetical protein